MYVKFARKRSVRWLKAQGMVEFALALPFILLVMLAVIEFGRLLFIYSAVFTASREAARYGAATSLVSGNTARYQDCAGMRLAARRIGNLVGITDGDIVIDYIDGNGVVLGACPRTISLGDRVRVRVTATYRPILPLVNLPPTFPIRSQAARTLLSHINVQGTPAAPPSGVCVRFETAGRDVIEDSAGTVLVHITLSAPTNHDVIIPFSVDASSTATSGVDYTLNTTSPLVVWSGRTGIDISLTVNPDTLYEHDESVILSLGSPTYATLCTPNVFALTIKNDDQPPVVSFTTASQSITEGAGTFIKAELNVVSGVDAIVPFSLDTISSTATLSSDFEFNTSSPLVIPAGQRDAEINLSTFDDALDEFDETIIVDMGTPVNATRGMVTTHTITIEDNDPQPYVAFAVDSQLVPRDAGTVPVRVELSAPSGKPVSVPFTLSGTARLGEDYTIQPSPLVITPGLDAANILINIIDPGEPFPSPKTVTLTMGQPTNATRSYPSADTVTITNFAPPPYVYFMPQAQSALESAGTIQVEAKLSWAFYQDITVPFNLGGTAILGSDYTISPSPVVIPAGSGGEYITINLVNDQIAEPDKTVIMSMGQLVNAVPASGWTVSTATILDDDIPPTVYFTSPSQSAQKDVGIMYVYARLSSLSGSDVTVPFTVGGTAVQGVDYSSVTPNGSVTIPANSMQATIQINVINNDNLGPDKTVVLTLGTPLNNAATPGSPSVHTATILAWVCPTAVSNPYFDPTNQGRLVWDIQGAGNYQFNLLGASINWPPDSGPLTGIVFGATPIWSNSDSTGSVIVSGSWSSSFASNQFSFVFGSRPSSGTINVTATFQHCPTLNGSISY